MSILLFETSSTSGAESLAADAKAGSLWGVSMGTTTKVSQYKNFALLELTQTRAFALTNAIPEDIELAVMDLDAPSFTESDLSGKVWYLRGLL
jgi:hypothetical protein